MQKRLSPACDARLVVVVSLAVVCLLACGFAGCAPAGSAIATIGVAEVSSPRATLVGFDDAIRRRDFDRAVQFIVPERRRTYREYYVHTGRYLAALDELKNSIREKIGPEASRQCELAIAATVILSPLEAARINGEVSWEKVSVTLKDDSTAMVFIGAADPQATLRRIQGSWFLGSFCGGAPDAGSMGALKRVVTALVRIVRDADAEVRSGRVTAESFPAFMRERFEWTVTSPEQSQAQPAPRD
ncbi:MAG: hypothetical protein JXL80_12980 [Planctomycetes bacterium]|nr:hypothetical protein [Planctomycetota bacterium]